MGRASGISAEQIANLNHYRNDFNFSDLERLVLRYADGMTQTPVDVPDALFARLREKFTEAQLVELTSAIAWENYRARFDHAFGIEAESFSEGAVCSSAGEDSPGPIAPAPRRLLRGHLALAWGRA